MGIVSATELVDRRQRAREAYADALAESAHVAGWPTAASSSERTQAAREAAIETATRVRITDEIHEAAGDALMQHGTLLRAADLTEVLRAAFRAAGFEVEQ
jgi:hypothetical protein